MSYGEVDGNAVRELFLREVGERVPAFDGAFPVGRARDVANRVGERRLTTSTVTEHDDVADVRGFKNRGD